MPFLLRLQKLQGKGDGGLVVVVLLCFALFLVFVCLFVCVFVVVLCVCFGVLFVCCCCCCCFLGVHAIARAASYCLLPDTL